MAKNINVEGIAYDLYTTSENIDIKGYVYRDIHVATENFMLGNAVLCSTNTGTSYYVEDNKSGYIFKWAED